MEHPQGVLSHREQERVDDPGRKSMGTASRRMLMTAMASTLGETLEHVKHALRGGITAAAIGAAAMGSVGHAVAADESPEVRGEHQTAAGKQLQHERLPGNDDIFLTVSEMEELARLDSIQSQHQRHAGSDDLFQKIGEMEELTLLDPKQSQHKVSDDEITQVWKETQEVRERFQEMIIRGVERALAQNPEKVSKGVETLIEGLGEFGRKLEELASAQFENTPSGKKSMEQQVDGVSKKQRAQGSGIGGVPF